MPHLMIEYHLEGSRPGYAFTPPVDGFDEAVLKAVWRQAMPRGQGWGGYIGARSMKCFPVDKRIMAVSEVTVTAQVDEQGRSGIRRAVITLIPAWKYDDFLRTRLTSLEANRRDAAHSTLTLARWIKIIEKALPRIGRKSQIVLAYPHRDVEQWQMIEALTLTLATSRGLRLVGGRIDSLTTLALTPREESRLVALPLNEARAVKGRPVINLT